MTTPKARTARRIVVTTVVVAALAVGCAVLLQRIRPDDTDDAPAAAPLKVATAERSDLSDVVSLDGTVESDATTRVVHRIEGATPSTSTQQSATPNPAGAQTAIAQGFASQSISQTAIVLLAAAVTEPTDPATTTTEPPTTTSSPPDTTPTPTTTTPSTTTTPPTTTQPTTTTATPAGGCDAVPTAPADPTASSTTTGSDPATCPESPTTTQPSPPASTSPAATPSGGRPSGGFPSGGGTTGAVTGSGGAGAPTGQTTQTITERVTSLPRLGATIELGDVIYSVDGSPVIAMQGTLPQWRALDSSSDDGIDIVQLESSLLALGYDDDGRLIVDAEWDSATTRAVKAWQQGLGLEATGKIALGDIVFQPEPATTVTAIHTDVGADVTEQDAILDVSGTSQRVVAAVTDEALATVTPGLAVQLDGDVPIDATVTLLRSVTSDDGTIGVEAVITPNAGTTNQEDGSSIDVLVKVAATSTNAITVPADALASRLDGTYAVQVRDAAGDHWVSVTIVEIQGSRVAVTGIDEGTSVLVPA